MSRIFLKGGKAQIYHLFEVSGSQTGFPKGLKKIRNSGRRRGSRFLELGGHGREGLKFSCHL